jgi:hypothetical protein
MEISDVKRRVVEAIDSAKREAAARRVRIDEAAHDYEGFLARVAVPIFRQVSNVLRAEGLAFTVFTPSGSVRLMSDRTGEDYIELTLDTAGDMPLVSGHASRSRGRRVIESERPIGPPATLSEDDVLVFLLKELAPLVER